jgi:hypothetical protein
MGITADLAAQHVAEWSAKLEQHRRKRSWPSHLFHVAHVSTAALIIRSGTIRARSLLPTIDHDVANQAALHNNTESHQFCRFYFRPRNEFQLSREGIKVIGDPFRPPQGENQLSVPIMFVFDAIPLLTQQQAKFTAEPASRRNLIEGNNNEFFQSMDFGNIYHDEPTTPLNRQEIHSWRKAEVLVSNQVPLANNLRRIICRSSLDVKTLRSYLSNQEWAGIHNLVQVEQIPESVFLHKGAYIKQLYFDSTGILNVEIKLADRQPATKTNYRLAIRQANEKVTIWNLTLRSAPAKYRLSGLTLQDGETVTVNLEDVLAYRGVIEMTPPELL